MTTAAAPPTELHRLRDPIAYLPSWLRSGLCPQVCRNTHRPRAGSLVAKPQCPAGLVDTDVERRPDVRRQRSGCGGLQLAQGCEARQRFCCRSTTCTGTRIVRAWFATARCTDWRIHQVAYVENL